MKKLDTIKCPDGYKMNFLTNHDENSWNGTEFERYGKGVETFAVLTYTLNGMPMIYSGQEVGFKKRLSFFEKDMIPSWTENATTKLYKKLNELKHTNRALIAGQGGEFRRYQTSANKELLVFSRTQGGREIMVLLNFSDKNISYVSNDALNKSGYTDYFTGAKVDNIPTSLKAWEYKVLVK